MFFQIFPVAHLQWFLETNIPNHLLYMFLKNLFFKKNSSQLGHNLRIAVAISRLYFQSVHALADKIITSNQNKARVNRVGNIIPVVQPTYEEEVLHVALHKIPKTISAKAKQCEQVICKYRL